MILRIFEKRRASGSIKLYDKTITLLLILIKKQQQKLLENEKS